MKKVILGALLCGVTAFAAVNLAACKGCHGQKWKKKALGQSKIVAEMTKAEVIAALQGYKAGTYGGAMKGLMKGQVAKYSDADLAAIDIGMGVNETTIKTKETKLDATLKELDKKLDEIAKIKNKSKQELVIEAISEYLSKLENKK